MAQNQEKSPCKNGVVWGFGPPTTCVQNRNENFGVVAAWGAEFVKWLRTRPLDREPLVAVGFLHLGPWCRSLVLYNYAIVSWPAVGWWMENIDWMLRCGRHFLRLRMKWLSSIWLATYGENCRFKGADFLSLRTKWLSPISLATYGENCRFEL